MVTRRLLLASLLGVGAILAGCPGSSNSSGSPIKADTPCPPGEFIRSVSVSYPSAVLLDRMELRNNHYQYVVPQSVCKPQEPKCHKTKGDWVRDNFVAFDVVENLGEERTRGLGSGSGFLPLRLQGTVDLQASLGFDIHQVAWLLASIDDMTVFRADRRMLLAGDFDAPIALEASSVQAGPIEQVPDMDVLDAFGLPACFEKSLSIVPLRITLDASRFSHGLHHLDVRWSFEKDEPQVRRLYFARILDAAGVLWKSDSVLWVGTARQGIFELNLGSDLKSDSDDTLTPVSFPQWRQEMNGPGPRASLASLDIPLDIPVESLTENSIYADMGVSQEYSGIIDRLEVSPSLFAEGGLGTGIQFTDPTGQKVSFELLGEGKLPDQDVSGIAVDRKGYLWASTFDLGTSLDAGVDGVSVFLPDFTSHSITWLANFDAAFGIKNDQILDVLVDARNTIWIPTYIGIYHLAYEADPSDKSNVRYTLDDRFPAAYQIDFISDAEALIANNGFSYLHVGEPAMTSRNDWVLTYPQLAQWAASFSTNSQGTLALASCSRRKLECYAFIRSIVGTRKSTESASDSRVGVSFDTLPCPGISFLRFGPDMHSSADDEVWRLYDAGGVGCGGTVLPPP